MKRFAPITTVTHGGGHTFKVLTLLTHPLSLGFLFLMVLIQTQRDKLISLGKNHPQFDH